MRKKFLFTFGVKDIVSRDFPEIIEAFHEWRQDLTSRMLEAWKAGRRDGMNEAIQEVLDILDYLGEVVSSGLSGYEVSNIFSDGSKELSSSHFKKI